MVDEIAFYFLKSTSDLRAAENHNKHNGKILIASVDAVFNSVNSPLNSEKRILT